MPKLNFTTSTEKITIEDNFELPKYTVLVGKNNSGKSWLLRSISLKIEPFLDETIGGQKDHSKKLLAKYISPERSGSFEKTSHLEDLSNSQRFMQDRNKVKNQSTDFFQDAISTFNGLINQIRKPPQENGLDQKLIDELNNKITDITFRLSTKADQSNGYNFIINEEVKSVPVHLSSGTMQVIALMMNVLDFVYSGKYAKDALLLLDEPDVHIHSDLQVQFVKFLIEVTKNTKHKILIATHSSSVMSGFLNTENSYIATKSNNNLNFYNIDLYLQKLLPSLGSHSLSHVFNSSPLLLVEGEDDELVWQYAIKNSGNNRQINFHIINATSKNEMSKYEKLISDIASKVFDSPKAYEIRDRDESTTEISDLGFIERSLLTCHEIENLILSDEVLLLLGYHEYDLALTKLKDLYKECRLKSTANHKENCKICKVIEELTNSTFDRYKADLKGSENQIISILKPDNRLAWEMLVGKAIGKNISSMETNKETNGSIYNMLGNKICSWFKVQ